MEILVLGLPRTGTQSLADALNILGYPNIYHMREVGKNQHQAKWIEALEAKFEGKGKPFGREEFDSFLSGYNGVADYPAAIFPRELIAAYPTAKIILSIRDEDKWYASMLATLWHQWSTSKSASDPAPSPMRPLSDKYQTLIWGGDFPARGRAQFRAHNALVRSCAGRSAQEGGFLEWDPRDGWAPLCGFLGKEVPKVPFPRVDDWLEYKMLHST
ncbi:hypothetical protein LSUB1_G006800 [Lachnellula subtilissima]|uniref:P-loop containing nucleoside triphosphate hydrolase protein n=1 Tax=Lachnellula subtilissima TaxID=602034 RepID=A0A8H8RGD9_9HELO|nr:hypothetical protein LSUB1_G006800 [Lachnellula subtilissima]